ncbi:hypothetical protein ALQ70_200158 [Pseudomonas savastanoi pv. glycinea]|nr:hypothetical protein ALQ70_200158 [Pseudomonas savastanoi pv. glycinea]
MPHAGARVDKNLMRSNQALSLMAPAAQHIITLYKPLLIPCLQQQICLHFHCLSRAHYLLLGITCVFASTTTPQKCRPVPWAGAYVPKAQKKSIKSGVCLLAWENEHGPRYCKASP